MKSDVGIVAVTLLAMLLLPAPAAGQEAELEGIGFVLGSEDAPVTIVEYSDFACSACAEFSRDTWPAVRARYVETGLVRWHVVPFDIGFKNSDEGGRAGQCAAEQGLFWQMHDALFQRQDEWAGERRPAEALRQIAAEIGVDPAQFRECYDDDRAKEPTKRASRAARQDGVRGTPTFFIDGFRIQGALPFEVFAEMIESARRGPRGD
ncbi:MAG: thioredoxin domain-containing protein [Chloroflexi bacterium]|nr:thioredoxin domain-containing protein [Chloroflexota bacterium]